MLKPWLWIPSQLAHDLSLHFLKLYGLTHSPKTYDWQSFDWRGLHFTNRLGIAGGVDKNATHVKDWWTLGPGFIEVGTVTPEPQTANPGKIMDRQIELQALWNKMGFPNRGSAAVAQNLAQLKERRTPIFVNIGRNRTTSNEEAAQDYKKCLQALHPYADAFVINISSPNTQGLRSLQDQSVFKNFLQTVLADSSLAADEKKPILVKFSPDLSGVELKDLLRTSAEAGVDGWILANTTLSRTSQMNFPKEGGVSGAPLAELAKKSLKTAVDFLGSERQGRLLISVGGVLKPEDVQERLEMGADLVQIYTALVYEGPKFFARTAACLAHS